MDLTADVLVVGGGPSGVVAALRLADLGHRVVLTEARSFPRNHVGEALGPGVSAQLEFLKLSGVIQDAAALRFSHATLVWGSDIPERRPMDPRCVTVDRAHFDTAMLNAARDRRVHVLQPAAVRDARKSHQGWDVLVEAADGRWTIAARFLVDASGRKGFKLRRRQLTSPATVALYAYWGGVGLPDEPCIRAGRDYWIWGSPVPGRKFNAMVFTDRTGLRTDRRGLAGRYASIIKDSALFAGRSRVDLITSVSACDATSYVDAASADAGYLKVGEAAFALDPLSSTGVQKAIQTGLTASVVINTILRRPEHETLAFQFYQEQQDRTVRLHRHWSTQSYREHRGHEGEAFWRARASGAAPDQPFAPARVTWGFNDRISVSPRER
jgi:flavin-dependent dehydrogenase